MLVLVPGHVVLSVHVSPVNVQGEVLSGVNFPSVGGGLDNLKLSLSNTAATLGLGEEVLGGG